MKAILIILMAIALGACSTIEGVGKDISATAVWSKDKMVGDEEEQY